MRSGLGVARGLRATLSHCGETTRSIADHPISHRTIADRTVADRTIPGGRRGGPHRTDWQIACETLQHGQRIVLHPKPIHLPTGKGGLVSGQIVRLQCGWPKLHPSQRVCPQSTL